jgi:hypothetical protein
MTLLASPARYTLIPKAQAIERASEPKRTTLAETNPRSRRDYTLLPYY